MSKKEKKYVARRLGLVWEVVWIFPMGLTKPIRELTEQQAKDIAAYLNGEPSPVRGKPLLVDFDYEEFEKRMLALSESSKRVSDLLAGRSRERGEC